MLQHEQTDPPTAAPIVPLPIPNAADARVTPDELNAALKALEDQQSSTVAIGSVVDELRLNVTPEEIWAQVENQRAQKSAEERAKQNLPGAAGPSRSFMYQILSHLRSDLFPPVSTKLTQTHRHVRRGWRQSKGWLWIIFWCTGGFGLFAGLPHLLSQTVTITGDSTQEAVPAQGKNILVLGDGDKITLLGHAHSVIILGDKTTLRGEAPKVYESLGDRNDVQWNSKP